MSARRPVFACVCVAGRPQEEVRQSVAPAEPVQYYFTLAQQPGTVQVQTQQQGQAATTPSGATTLQPGQIIITQPQQSQVRHDTAPRTVLRHTRTADSNPETGLRRNLDICTPSMSLRWFGYFSHHASSCTGLLLCTPNILVATLPGHVALVMGASGERSLRMPPPPIGVWLPAVDVTLFWVTLKVGVATSKRFQSLLVQTERLFPNSAAYGPVLQGTTMQQLQQVQVAPSQATPITSAPVTMQVGEGQQVQIVQAAAQGQAAAQTAGQTMQVMQQIITNTGEIQQIPVQLNAGQLQYIRLAQPVSGTQVVQGQIQTLATNAQQQLYQIQQVTMPAGQELTQPMFIQSTSQTADGQVTTQVSAD
ncbi:hypothetical protein Z043_122163 [Scleropages formosus]|uniref:Nuclear transcription factor Y subunit gamma-like n=1 Tax=Scleropages formosus TaxID=113540 RepID=A0A0P7Y2I1_SCLFO|nr:hypothetical protein Z043_122163 [Scleropages formosus]